jgi:hypothetical protein
MMIDKVDKGESLAHQQLWEVATAVQEACYAAAVTAYENASIDGLCHEGAWECAVDAMRAAMRTVNVDAIIQQ